MTNNSESVAAQPEQINLKHRITGAGVLIFFCALVLPWLLGPPSEAQKSELDQANTGGTQDTKAKLHSTFEDEVLAELEGVDTGFEEPEEKVYVSKITPISANSSATPSEPKRVDNDKQGSGQKKEAEKAPAKKSQPQNITSGDVKKAAEKPKESPAKTEVKKDESPEPVESKTQKKTEDKVANNKSGNSKTVAKSESKKIEVGLVVQVELLTDKQGAERLVKDLRAKGFTPRTTVIDTNKGKNTGTRIWLGPFESRKLAAAENDRLESKMGKRGFIRVYP